MKLSEIVKDCRELGIMMTIVPSPGRVSIVIGDMDDGPESVGRVVLALSDIVIGGRHTFDATLDGNLSKMFLQIRRRKAGLA